MSYIRGWRAYTADSVYSSTTHTPTQLPTIGIQVIMLYFRDGTRRILHGNERYFYQSNGSDDGIWASTDDPAVEIAIRYPGAHIMEGELLADVLHDPILRTSIDRKEP